MGRDWPFEQCASQRSKPSSLRQPEPFSFLHSLFSSSVLFSFKISQRPFSPVSALALQGYGVVPYLAQILLTASYPWSVNITASFPVSASNLF